MATISTANTLLTGAGATTVFTAGGNGAIIKSIIIKATMASLQGMVRIFIGNNALTAISLYKEVPICATPQASAVSIPAPQYAMFEITLTADMKLASGYKILASTQNQENFNIIVEGVNWVYPKTLPATCCNFKQVTALTGVATVSSANTNLDGTGNISPLFSVGVANGGIVKAITVKALQSTLEGMLRFFVSPNGTSSWLLFKEVWIAPTTLSAFEPGFKQVLDMNYNLQSGYFLGVTTQLAQSFSITAEGESYTYPIN